MDALGQSALLVAVTTFALGISVLSRNVRNILFLSFAMVTTLVSTWALAFFLEKLWPDTGFYRLHLLFNVLITPASLVFIRVLVRIHDQFSRRLLTFSILQSLILSTALLFQFDSIPWVLQLIYFSPVLVVVQTLKLMWNDHALKNGTRKSQKTPIVGLNRRSWIYIGALVVLATSVMDHVTWMGQILPSFGNLALTVYIFFLSQAITQQRLLNISALISRFLVLLVVALTLTVIYSLLVVWAENSPGLFFLNSFIASFLLLTLLEPLRTLVSYLTQRLLTKKHRKLWQYLRDEERKLVGIVDSDSLFQAILRVSEQVLKPQWCALFVLRADGIQFRRIRVLGESSHSELYSTQEPIFREVLSNHPMFQYCENQARKGKFPVLLDQILESEIDRSASKAQREYFSRLREGLKALGCNLLIPLIASEKILGFVALWVPFPPDPWGNNWGLLPIFYPYFEQAAQSMQNMEVYVRQREKERLAALGEMAAGLAHEIRNPLGAIKGAAQFLDPSAEKPESRFLTIIIEEVDRLNRVVTQFLDYSKPPAEDFIPLDLDKLASKTVELMRAGIRTGIDLEFLPSQIPARVLASPGQIQQVLINLIQNSVVAMEGLPQGTIRVKVGAEGDIQRHEIALTVEDNGKGIKRENLEKIFIPFFTTSPGGTGLGLPISQKIIEAHRGRIEVRSEVGRFTKFSVILPLMKE